MIGLWGVGMDGIGISPGWLAIAAMVLTLAGFILRGFMETWNARSQGQSEIHRRIDALVHEMPKDYVPRAELNGKLDRLHADNKRIEDKLDRIIEAKP